MVELQVCLSMCDIFVTTRHWRVKVVWEMRSIPNVAEFLGFNSTVFDKYKFTCSILTQECRRQKCDFIKFEVLEVLLILENYRNFSKFFFTTSNVTARENLKYCCGCHWKNFQKQESMKIYIRLVSLKISTDWLFLIQKKVRHCTAKNINAMNSL